LVNNHSQADPPKKRIFYLDQLRALAIVAIILCHVANLWAGSPNGSFNWDMRYFFNIAGRFGVPIFLMLSGVLLLNRDYKIWEFMKRRFPRILNPFIFWMIIAIIFGVISQDKFSYFNSVTSAVPYIVKTFLTSRWYVWMIIGVYLVMPIINDFVKNRGLRGVEYFLLLWFITSILSSLSLYFNKSMYFLDLSFFAGPVGYVLLGYYLHNKEFKFSPDKLMIFGLVLFISSILIKTFLVYNGQLDPGLLRYYIFQTKSHLEIDILAFLQAIGIFMVFKYLNHENTHRITNKISSILKEGIMGKLTVSLSRSSYGIYLNHYIFIGIIGVSGFDILTHNALKWVPFIVIVVLLCAWVLLLILDKIPYLNKVTGYH
jgi:surface polysaccharide O-acyltransferase-like enzyme